MLIFFGILILLSCIVLGFIILVQNPKGGGLSASFGGIGNQLMGVKQTTDVLEKGTWIFAAIVGILCLTSSVFIPKAGRQNSERDELINNAPASNPLAPKANSSNTAPLQTTPPAKP
jgi:preprotein translocase subunit SecG